MRTIYILLNKTFFVTVTSYGRTLIRSLVVFGNLLSGAYHHLRVLGGVLQGVSLNKEVRLLTRLVLIVFGRSAPAKYKQKNFYNIPYTATLK